MAYNKAVKIIEKAMSLNKSALSKTVYNWIDQWRGNAGVIEHVQNQDIALGANGAIAIQNGHVAPNLQPTLTWIEAKALARKMDDLYVGSDHLQVKYSATWKQIYQVAQRNIPFMDNNGTLGTRAGSTVPCHNCGVVIPFEFLQVDHFMPQAGGSDFHLLKYARAMGLTTAAPSGSKGTAMLNSQSLTGLTLHPKGRDRTYNHLGTPSAAGKWTTTAKGTAFLSLLIYADGYDDAARMCKNNLLNLVPLCPECNRVKSDWMRPIQ